MGKVFLEAATAAFAYGGEWPLSFAGKSEAVLIPLFPEFHAVH